MARPTKYQKKFCKALLDHMSAGKSLATFAGYLFKEFGVKVNPDTTYEWAKVQAEFSEAKRIGDSLHRLFYEEKLLHAIDKGMRGFPSSPWIFSMKNLFGWRDTPDDNPLDDRPTLADIMNSVEKHESNQIAKKKSARKSTKKRSRRTH
jgi:hypothetical protein